jgi:hypothetical protein
MLLVFAFAFSILTVGSYIQQSATGDEPGHLVEGYAALTLGDYRVDPEHPPLLRMWAALPLLAMSHIDFDTNSVYWPRFDRLAFSHEFYYEKNDGDRLLYPARFMIVILGLVLGVFVFRWAQELYGFWPAVIVLALYTTEPNMLAHASLVTTDMGVTCFMFGALYFLWRTCRRLTIPNGLLFVALFALAQVGKFSALTLWPMMAALFLVRILRSEPWAYDFGSQREIVSRKGKMLAALSIAAVLVVTCYIAMWAVYDFRYAPAPKGSGLLSLHTNPNTFQHPPRFTGILNWIDKHHWLPSICTQGFLLGQGLGQEHPTYLAGHINETGWWYYFPVAFAIKTPIALLLLFGSGLVLVGVRREGFWARDIFLLVPPMLYGVAAMTQNLNIGLRHILPIYPFVLLLAGRAVQELWLQRRRALHVMLGALCLLQVDEVAFVYPHFLSFFNQFIGGPRNGYKYLADSNIDWGQDLKGLKKWMDNNGVRAINLSYFGIADPAYYGINCSYLYPSPFFAEGRDTHLRLPGYVAVSVQNLLGLSTNPPRPDLYKKLLESEPVAVIGYSIRIYWVEKPWR